MALQVHFQAWFRCSVMSSLPIRTIQFQRIYGISTFHSVLRARAPCRRSFVIATLCRVHTIQHMEDKEFHSQQSPSRISIAAQHPLRISKYSEKLAYESTCCRLWAQGIQTHIQDEQEKVHKWIEGMTEDFVAGKACHVCSATLDAIHGTSIAASPSSSSTSTCVPQAQLQWCRSSQLHMPGILLRPSASTVDPWADAKKKQQR